VERRGYFLLVSEVVAGEDDAASDEGFDSLALDPLSLFSFFGAADPDWFFFA
jgi:hypothetical protein